MKTNNMLELIKSKNIVIPVYIYKLYPKLNISLDCFIFLMYLYNCGESILFDPNKISEDFGVSVQQVLDYTDKLSTSKLLKFEIKKNDKNVSEEYLSLEFFYDRISILIMDNVSNLKQNNSNDDSGIYDMIEKEFGRILSPIEYEIIKAWRENNNSDEIIQEALKEAVFNGVSNLRYMDRILSEWQKKGIKTVEDVNRLRKEHKAKTEKIEVFEYNWLDDDE